MAELSLVYGGNTPENNFSGEYDYDDRQRAKQSQGHSQQTQQGGYQGQSVQQTGSSSPNTTPMIVKEQYQNNMKEGFQNMSPQEYTPSYRRSQISFWDKMSMKRPEVMKLAIFSLVIVLAIAIDKMSSHYLSKYISDNIFTDFQEFMLRLSYPVIIFLILWIVKSL